MSNRRADAGMFGFDFQVNAAIVLMLENIKTLSSVRLEGNEEDIVLTLDRHTFCLSAALLFYYLVAEQDRFIHQTFL